MRAPDGFEPNVIAVPINSQGELARVVIRKGDGRVFDLGKPNTLMFKLRLWNYKRLMKKEM
jgi:hypothetical protein